MPAGRFWGLGTAFDHPATAWLVGAAALLLIVAGVLVAILTASRAIPPALARELRLRTLSWAALAAVMGLVILIGPGWFILAVGLLSLLCFNEFARATGLFRERLVYLMAVIGIAALTFATLDHWYGFYVALGPLGVVAIAVAALLGDEPEGYTQRAALGVFGFIFFGVALGHFGYMGNDAHYRPIVILLLLAVAISDVGAYAIGKSVGGKLIGGRKLAPNTSPNKTVAGTVGGFALCAVVLFIGSGYVFAGTAFAGPLPRAGLALVVAAAAPCGDLMMSAIKRDVGIKDAGTALPGHGGFVDRFDSLILVAPAAFHFIGQYIGFGLDQPTRILTGG